MMSSIKNGPRRLRHAARVQFPPVRTAGQGGTYILTLPLRDAEGFELAKTSTKNAGYLMVLSVHDDALIQAARPPG
jgi:hypothetical protein